MTFSLQPLEFPLATDRDWIERELTSLPDGARIGESLLLGHIGYARRSYCICGVRGMGKTSLLNEIAFTVNTQAVRVIAIGPLSMPALTRPVGSYELQTELQRALSEVARQSPNRIKLPDSSSLPRTFEQFPSLLEKLASNTAPKARFLILLDDLDGVSVEDRKVILSDLKNLMDVAPQVKFLCAGNFLDDEFPSAVAPLTEDLMGFTLGAFGKGELEAFFGKVTRHFDITFDQMTSAGRAKREAFKGWAQSVPYFLQAITLTIREHYPSGFNIGPRTLEDIIKKFPGMISLFLMEPLAIQLNPKARSKAEEIFDTLLRSEGVVAVADVDWDDPVVRDLWRWGIIWRNKTNHNMVWAAPLLEKWFKETGPRIDSMPWGAGPPHRVGGKVKKKAKEKAKASSPGKATTVERTSTKRRRPPSGGSIKKGPPLGPGFAGGPPPGPHSPGEGEPPPGPGSGGGLGPHSAGGPPFGPHSPGEGEPPPGPFSPGEPLPLAPSDKSSGDLFRQGGMRLEVKRRMPREHYTVESPEPSEEKRVINTGFASRNDPDKLLNKMKPLAVPESYYFWVDRGRLLERESIEETPMDIPQVADGARLTIAVFGFQDGIEVVPGEDVGEVEVQGGGPFAVISQPAKDSPPKSVHLHERLYFPVQLPARDGTFQMRCNIYLGQLLLQSRLISARVTTSPKSAKRSKKALSSVLDYTLSRQLDPSHLAKLTEHRLSILLNKNSDGSHSMHFYGSDGEDRFKQDDVRFDLGALHAMINDARGTLRMASWGTENELVKEGYKYQDRQKRKERLQEDLINLAKWGYEFYSKIRKKLAGARAGDRQAVVRFEQLMLEPGVVQIAMKESPSYVLPAALLYDYPLDSASASGFSLCPTFEKALDQNEAFEHLDCFLGRCPSRGNIKTVCPSGFWGFRHSLGMPLSEENKSDVCAQILVERELRMAVGVATNLNFVKEHAQSLEADARKLKNGIIWKYADTRDKVFDYLKESPHIVYFYCHGGLARESLPYLQVGPIDSDLIFPSTLETMDVFWEQPRPLVFINGCHTTAVDPLKALEFISPLMTNSRSAGVIGTEITIFEELATVFAQECLARFCANEPIGKAIRSARLKVLAEGNPLGLVYIPFVMAGLKLEYQSAH